MEKLKIGDEVKVWGMVSEIRETGEGFVYKIKFKVADYGFENLVVKEDEIERDSNG